MNMRSTAVFVSMLAVSVVFGVSVGRTASATSCTATVNGTSVSGVCLNTEGYTVANCGTGLAYANVATGSTCSPTANCCVLRAAYTAAQAGTGGSASSIGGIDLPTGTGLSTMTPMTLLTNILRFLLYMIGGVAILFLVYAGFQYILAAGDETKIKEAKHIIMYSIIGIVVALVSLILVSTLTGLVAGTVAF